MFGPSSSISGISSLRRKVLIPFFVILATIGTVATVGSIYVITDSMTKTADKRLTAFQQQVYREIRNVETDLLHKSRLLELSYRISHSATIPGSDNNTIEGLIDEVLIAKNIRAQFIDPDLSQQTKSATLAEMFSQAQSSKKNRIRFTTDLGTDPALTLVTPVVTNDVLDQFILVQKTLDQSYFKEVAETLDIKLAILDIDGEPLIKSHDNIGPYQLTAPLLQRIFNGERVFITNTNLFTSRTLYSVIPLGTTDTILLAVELPMTDIAELISIFFTRSAMTILAALLIGSFVFYRLIGRISQPVEDVLAATHAISEGNLDYRLQEKQVGEFKQLAHSFNSMMGSLSTLQNDRVQQERELTVIQEELRFKSLLEDKNREIEKFNRELSLHNKELSVLLQITQEMSTTLDLNSLIGKILNALKDLLNCQIVILLMYNPGSEILEVNQTLGIDTDALADVTFKLSEGISGESARTKKTTYVPDLKIDKRYLSYKKTLTVFGSMLSIPLISHNKLCGVLNLHKDKIQSFSDDEIKLSEAVASQAAIAIENAKLYQFATELSITDELTGLSNRRHFHDILNREFTLTQRYTSSLSLIMIDIDHFKKYNDYHGHLQGDVVLKKVANSLLHNTRGIDLTCRFGGEEFIILLPKTTAMGAIIAAEKLRSVIEAESFAGEEKSQPGGRLTLSLGVSSYPDDTSDINNLLELADQALYKAKNQGRNRVASFSDKN